MKKVLIINVEKIILRRRFGRTCYIMLKIEAAPSSETLVTIYQTIRRYVAEDRTRKVIYLWFI
jgi:hypothetical protein